MVLLSFCSFFNHSRKAMKPMLCRSHNLMSRKTILILIFSALLTACASERQVASDQPIEKSFHAKVAECSKIADRSERDRCLYGN